MARKHTDAHRAPVVMTYSRLTNAGYDTWEKILADWEVRPGELTRRPIANAVTAALEHSDWTS